MQTAAASGLPVELTFAVDLRGERGFRDDFESASVPNRWRVRCPRVDRRRNRPSCHRDRRGSRRRRSTERRGGTAPTVAAAGGFSAAQMRGLSDGGRARSGQPSASSSSPSAGRSVGPCSRPVARRPGWRQPRPSIHPRLRGEERHPPAPHCSSVRQRASWRRNYGVACRVVPDAPAPTQGDSAVMEPHLCRLESARAAARRSARRCSARSGSRPA